MKNCPFCNTQLEDDASFCHACGNAQNAQPQPEQPYQQPGYAQPPVSYPAVDPHDHSAEFSAEDVAANKLYAILLYLLGPVGIIIALLADKESAYLRFHIRQVLKLLIVEILAGLATLALSWTIIAAAAGGVFIFILGIVEIICLVRTCQGKSVDVPIIGDWKFLN